MKTFIKLYFVASIVLVSAVTLALSIVLFGQEWTFYQSVGLSYSDIEGALLGLIRLWIGNIGLSSFIAVVAFAYQEAMDYTAKTALYTFIVNVIYAFILIVVLRRVLKKKPFSLGSLV